MSIQKAVNYIINAYTDLKVLWLRKPLSKATEGERWVDGLVLTCLSVVSKCLALAHNSPCASLHIFWVMWCFMKCYYVRYNWQTPHQNLAWKHWALVCLKTRLCYSEDTTWTKGAFKIRLSEAAVRHLHSSLIACLGLSGSGMEWCLKYRQPVYILCSLTCDMLVISCLPCLFVLEVAQVHTGVTL